MVKRRKELAAQSTFFAESFGALADAEELESLNKAMHQMADVEVKVARLHSKQVRIVDCFLIDGGRGVGTALLFSAH